MNPGSEMMKVVLQKETPNQAWGFRLQGGCDFTIPLSVQSVNPGGLAERYGLKAGDAVLSINDRSSDTLEHEEAKGIILNAGREVTMLVQRGAVRVWKPKVTPMSELKSGVSTSSNVPYESNGNSEYKVSLAADKQEFAPIGSTHNRSARPFKGFGGGSAGAPTVAAPVAMPPQQSPQYSDNYASAAATGQASQQYRQQTTAQTQAAAATQEYGQPGLGSNMGSTSISDKLPAPPSGLQLQQLSLGPPSSSQNSARLSPTFKAIQDAGGLNGPKVVARPVSPRYAALQSFADSGQHESSGGSLQAPAQSLRSMSPTLRLIQQEEGIVKPSQEVIKPAEHHQMAKGLSAVEQEAKEGEEIRYQGFMDHNKQSKAFKIVQSELDQGHEAPSMPSGIRSVRAPTTKPPGEGSKNQQYMTCKSCGTLIVGVFVKVSGEPLHPECFKCVDCGKNLKNQGHFNVNGKLYCDVHARTAAQPPAPDMYATPVYR